MRTNQPQIVVRGDFISQRAQPKGVDLVGQQTGDKKSGDRVWPLCGEISRAEHSNNQPHHGIIPVDWSSIGSSG